MPIRSNNVGERPLYSGQRNSFYDLRIAINVGAVIEVDEFMSEGLAKDQPDCSGKGKRNEDQFPDRLRGLAHLAIDRFFIAIGQNKRVRPRQKMGALNIVRAGHLDSGPASNLHFACLIVEGHSKSRERKFSLCLSALD